ncbi:MAG: polysaccharide pyruvyl transferase family protein, partial [Candidatus Atribacteria bacterium]|nr:polysaccharide pyruvyl transferase family protein [Candidatus Atribacteria bacterium]
KPIVFYRSGLGPFRRKLSRWLVHIILKRTVLFIARDPETRDLALSLGCRKERTVLGIDPVCSWQENDEKEGDRGKRIAIFVREGMNEKKDLVLEGVHRLKEKTPCEVEFVAFHRQSDESVASHFAEASGAQWRYFHSPEEIWTYFSHLSAVFTMRLHPAVIASVMGVPWFAFDIDPKIISFSGLWGGTNLIHWQELSVDTFWERYTRRDEICPTLSTLAQTIQERTRESEESLENFIEAIWGSRS